MDPNNLPQPGSPEFEKMIHDVCQKKPDLTKEPKLIPLPLEPLAKAMFEPFDMSKFAGMPPVFVEPLPSGSHRPKKITFQDNKSLYGINVKLGDDTIRGEFNVDWPAVEARMHDLEARTR